MILQGSAAIPSDYKVTICNHQDDSPLYMWPDVGLVTCKFRKSMVIHDTECPY